ncbi:poly [ADP-ribose] polymerase 14 isoform X2, partial [Silurus meridionalis]
MDEYIYPLLVEGDWSSVNFQNFQKRVHIYFQNRRKSQGGDCVIERWTDRSCTVLFKQEEVRDQVLAKAEHSVPIENHVVKLKVSKPSSEPENRPEEKPQHSVRSDVSAAVWRTAGLNASQTKGNEGLEDTSWSCAAVLENVPENLSKEYLMLLVDSIGSCSEDECSLELIPESNAAVVTFSDVYTVENFLTACKTKKKFQEYGLKARRLENTSSFKVENLPANCSDDLLELLFEKHVGSVERIKAIADERAAIVTFRDQPDVHKVLRKEYFTCNNRFDIYPYYHSLGSALYGKDRPTWTLPKPFTYKIHPAIREFLKKKGQISSICNQMSSHCCQVNVDKPEVQFSPLPALLRQKGITKMHIDNWQENTMDAFKNILSSFAVFEHAVTRSVWTAVEKDIRSVVKDKAVLEVDISTGCLTLAGMAKDINMLKPILENVLKSASSQIEREINKTSEIIYMPHEIFLLLQHEGLQNMASAKYSQLELMYNKNTHQLTLTGLHAEIMDIKNFVLESQLRKKEKALQKDPSLLEFLRSVNCEEMSVDLFISKGINAVYRIENGNTVLTACTDKALAEAEKRLEMMLTLQCLSVEDLHVLEKPEWKALSNQLYETYNSSRKKTVLMKYLKNKVMVCGFQEPVREVSKSLEQFIDKHSRIEETVRVKSYAVVKFIREKMAEVWQKFLKGEEMDIHFDTRPLIRISGERINVQPVVKSFQKIAGCLHTDSLIIRKAGAKKYFQEQGSIIMMMIKQQRFVVVLEDASMKDDDEESYDDGGMDGFGKLYCEVQIPGGIVIKVLESDICQFKVDAVVNAANEDLKHIGGLALALLNAAGPSLQQMSDQYVAKSGKLLPGNAITTDAGQLPCKYVVHAVGPRFNNSDRLTAVKKLRQAVRESLKEAVLKRCSSIAVPAISSGIFGFPLDLCAETIARELHAYVEAPGGMNTLKEIYLVDNNPKTVNAMAQAVGKEFIDFNLRMSFPQQIGHGNGHYIQNQGQGHRGTGARGNKSGFFEPRKGLNSNPQSKSQLQDIGRSGLVFLQAQTTVEGLKIILKKGNIQDACSDVIVNTISEDLDLSKGAVSKALLKAAGPQLQAETRSQNLKALGDSNLSYGDIVVTNSYNLKCKKVFHTVCPFWNRGGRSEVEVLRQIIRNCLRKAENQKMPSISFPAIGTGNLGFPRSLVSTLLLSEIHAYSARFSTRYLTEVNVIVHPSDSETVQCFEKSFRGEKQETVTEGAHAVQPPAKNPRHFRPPPSAEGFFGPVSTPSLGVHQMRIGHLKLEISSGDITKERCDAIVNSSNKLFSLKSGVSKAILDAAGLAVEGECAQIVASQSQQSDMIMTTGGQLPCRQIIHVIGRNSPAEIKIVVYSVLKFCEEQKFSSVAFPALGTGQGGANPSAVADAMTEAVFDFVKKKKGLNLKSVKFLIFQTSMVSDFHKCMLKRSQDSVEEEGGVMNWVKGTFETVTNFFRGGNAETETNLEDFVFVGEEFEPVVFQLCGESEDDLKEARNLINGFIVKEHVCSNIMDSAINYFGQEEAEVLSKLQRELTVSIHLSNSSSEPEFTLEGLTRDVVKAESTIRDMIRKVEKKMTRQSEAFLLSTSIEWQYQDRRENTVPFDILTNYDLEQAFRTKQPCVKIAIDKVPYEAHVQYFTAVGKNRQIQLKRIDLKQKNTVSLPSHWEDMKGNLVLSVTIQQGSQEYTTVENEFRRTGLTSQILKIERIQNETLWNNYMNQKSYLEKKNKHTNNEKLLFHGTGSDNIIKINERGFNRSYAGMHGAMYGNGVYFAVDPNYSAQGYSKPDINGHKRMYLARVLVGDSTTGKAGLLAPPAKNSTGTEQYDSVTDRQQSMFVIFHDIYAYPEYLITF